MIDRINKFWARVTRTMKDVRNQEMRSEPILRGLMTRYQVDKLNGCDAQEFEKKINDFLDLDDRASEQCRCPSKQRDLSLRFNWGHNHDFGSFRLSGMMGERHVRLLAVFIDRFGALPLDLSGMKILDVGCWTGGTSLLMCAMGAEVLAIEEVKKYADSLDCLKQSFGIKQLTVKHASLYELTGKEYWDRFDYVLMAGVLYHVTDPIVALRITYNCLKDKGSCLLETTAVRSKETIISFARRRWNWFDLSPSSLRLMMGDVGYSRVTLQPITPDNRIYAVATRETFTEMRRDGLSVRHIR